MPILLSLLSVLCFPRPKGTGVCKTDSGAWRVSGATYSSARTRESKKTIHCLDSVITFHLHRGDRDVYNLVSELTPLR